MLCKYDLKGSTLNREEKVDFENIQKIVLKDVNFEAIEKYLMICEKDKLRLNEIVRKDAIFLSNLDIMDYSLLVVKINMSKLEVDDPFKHRPKRFSENMGSTMSRTHRLMMIIVLILVIVSVKILGNTCSSP